MQTKILTLVLITLFAAPFLRADDAQSPTAEARLRSALRDTMLQLRDAQNQAVTLQAAQAQSDKDKTDLQAKVEALTAQLKSATDQAASDKALAEKDIADLKAQVQDQAGQIARLTDGLKQWKDAYAQVDELEKSKETARAQLALQAALLQRTVDDRETKNLALFKLGNDILSRYERFGLGDAISAKEPFIGTARVKLENLVQDYKNKLLDQAVTTGSPVAQPPAPQPAKPVKTSVSSGAQPANPT